MQRTNSIIEFAGVRREDLSVCLGCKICASVCTVNDLGLGVNPQELLARLFLGEEINAENDLVRYCTGCYRCTAACPWQVRVPDVVMALREELHVASPFEKAFKTSVAALGRVYEPFVFMRAFGFLVKEGYLKHLTRWTGYMSFHLPHKVKRR